MNEINTAEPPVKTKSQDENMWAMILHLSQFAYYVVPVAWIVAPIVIWQIKKKEFPSIDQHGKIIVNWMINALIAGFICIPLLVVFIGIPLLIALSIAHVVFAIIGAIKANSGELWPYPWTLIKIF